MVNPQLEDGHLDIANEIVEYFARYRLSGQEWQVLWVILRKTWGWHKKKDRLSLGYISKMTLMKRPAVARAIKKLVNKCVIKKDNSYINIYMFNKDYEMWKSVIKKDTLLSKRITGVIKKDNKSVINIDTTTKENTKETYTKENKRDALRSEIIEYLNKVTHSKYKSNTPVSVKHINARLKEGFTLEDFKYVVDVKWVEWGGKFTNEGKSCEDWMRPITLFGPKFEGYLNQEKPDSFEEYLKKE
jgi:phage replication O-like protein O